MGTYIIVGTGIIGSSAAYHLAKAGNDVTVIDADKPERATDAAAGIINPWLSQRRNKAWYRLAENGARFYPELVERLKADGQTKTGYRQVGALSLHTDREKLHDMKERALKQRETAPEIGDIQLLDAAETVQQFPLINERYQSLYIEGAARVNGRALRHALLEAASDHGARSVQGEAELLYDGNNVYGVSVGGAHYEADRVIACNGMWMRELLKPLEVDFQITGQKGQIVHLYIPDMQTSTWPVVKPPGGKYLLTLDDHRFIAGATREDNPPNSAVTADGMNEVLQKTLNFFPGLRDSQIQEVRVGFRPFTPESLPVFGKVPGIERLYIANGLGATGLTIGPYLGSELAKLASGEDNTVPLSDYDPTLVIR